MKKKKQLPYVAESRNGKVHLVVQKGTVFYYKCNQAVGPVLWVYNGNATCENCTRFHT